jgi:hypothetical protein
MRRRSSVEPYPAQLERAGDALQREASRLAEWVAMLSFEDLPYEVAGALHGVQRGAEKWDEVRTS